MLSVRICMQRLGSPSSSPKGLSQKKDNGATSQKQIERPQSAGTKLMLSVAERAQQAGKGRALQSIVYSAPV